MTDVPTARRSSPATDEFADTIAAVIALADAVTDDLDAGLPVALGFECPLFVPVPDEAELLGSAREGDGNRPWCVSRVPHDVGAHIAR